MTREEEIDNAKNAFYKRILEDGYYYDPRDCFEEGADWADANPKSSWISVKDDLPCNHKEFIEDKYFTKPVLAVLALNENPSIKHMEVCRMCDTFGSNMDWHWCNGGYHHVVYWMPLPKMPD